MYNVLLLKLEFKYDSKFSFLIIQVLLSYDVNLCNKAMIHDIVTLGRNDPIEKIDYLNATNMNQSLSVSNDEDQERFSLNSTILSEELKLSNEIYEDIKSIMRDFLTVVSINKIYVVIT